MPNGNPEFTGDDQLVRMYRGGVAGAWDLKGMKQGYLISKLMDDWLGDDRRSPEMAALTQSLPASQKLQIGDKLYKKPLLQVESGAILGASMRSIAAGADAFARRQHSVSSSRSTSIDPPTGPSAYVGMTPTLQVAISFCSPTELVWQFDVWKSDLWRGGVEDEWLARGGTPIFNVRLSRNSGVSFGAP